MTTEQTPSGIDEAIAKAATLMGGGWAFVLEKRAFSALIEVRHEDGRVSQAIVTMTHYGHVGCQRWYPLDGGCGIIGHTINRWKS